jgi:hypothetical protein
MPEFAGAPEMPAFPAYGASRPIHPLAAKQAERREQMQARRDEQRKAAQTRHEEARKAAETRRTEALKASQARRASLGSVAPKV